MTDSLTFASTSPLLGLPMLFTGQAQKEVFVNEAHSRIDAVVHCAIEGSSATSGGAKQREQLAGWNRRQWRLEWNGGRIACYQSGNWLFVTPFDGFRSSIEAHRNSPIILPDGERRPRSLPQLEAQPSTPRHEQPLPI
jgi:hypothetical protein